jgi:hypothetical protein
MTSAVQTALMLRRDRFRIEKQNETELAFWVNERDICLPFRFLETAPLLSARIAQSS